MLLHMPLALSLTRRRAVQHVEQHTHVQGLALAQVLRCTQEAALYGPLRAAVEPLPALVADKAATGGLVGHGRGGRQQSRLAAASAADEIRPADAAQKH
jgi:hypothetical protein